ncbi:La-related protein 4B [Camelus dromedarius]|uniref:La-related protein 4B n=1 Tax=Camelus dromedarius TaxID=9838 RepID=A0A5N4ECF0_CAMDR|nr:La-related protein 4B [Camelus dromedarius]
MRLLPPSLTVAAAALRFHLLSSALEELLPNRRALVRDPKVAEKQRDTTNVDRLPPVLSTTASKSVQVNGATTCLEVQSQRYRSHNGALACSAV